MGGHSRGRAGNGLRLAGSRYEVAVSAAAGDLRTGHEIRIEVVGDAYDRTGDGSQDANGRS
jgi:hypothetical protein